MDSEDCEDGFVIPDRADLVREVARDAHIEARHSSPWEVCPDPVCAAMERWVSGERLTRGLPGFQGDEAYVPLERPMVRG